MKLITISGLDGSGKTTQLNLLEKYLRKNFQVERLHMIDFSIANKILSRKIKKPGQSKAQTKTGFWGIYLRKTATVIDVFRFRIFYQIKAFENKIDYLLVDRYFYDQIANIKYLDNRKKIKKQSFWQTIAENHIIHPDLKIYLKIEPQKIIKRSRQIEQGKDYLNQKYELYEKFSKKWKLTRIDGNDTQKNIQQKINQLI